MYAIWKYDLFPFILTGEVKEGPDDEGRVEVKGYDKMSILPAKLVSDKKGQEVQKLIDKLREEYTSEIQQMHRRGQQEINKIVNLKQKQ